MKMMKDGRDEGREEKNFIKYFKIPAGMLYFFIRRMAYLVRVFLLIFSVLRPGTLCALM